MTNSKLKGESADAGSKTLPRDELLHGLRSRLRTAGKVSEGDTSEKIETGGSGLTVVTPKKPRERKKVRIDRNVLQNPENCSLEKMADKTAE